MIKATIKEPSTLAAYLSRRGYRSGRIRQLLRFKAISVNGATVARYDYPLVPGDEVAVSSAEESRAAGVLKKSHIPVVYEDEELIVIDKPAGLLTIATEAEKTRTAYRLLNEYLKERSPAANDRVFIVHRLDRETSGLLVMAKTPRAKRALQAHWRDADKRYLAVVEGVPGKKEDTLSGVLKESAAFKVHLVCDGERDSEAKQAITHYRVLRAGRGYALLDVRLETGRKNQIRVHLAGIGHPVAGDKKYGARTDPLARLGLHAHLLAFKHPATGKRLSFRSEAPEAFAQLVRSMRPVT